MIVKFDSLDAYQGKDEARKRGVDRLRQVRTGVFNEDRRQIGEILIAKF